MRFRHFIQFNESVLHEDITAVRKQYPKISDEMFNKLIAFDPTFNKDRDSVGTYGKWILNGYNKGNITDNDFGHLKDVLTRFEDNKKNLKDKDIGKFKTVQDLDDYLNNDDNYKELSHRQEVRQRQKDRKSADLNNDAKLVYEGGDWEVWIPQTYAASCKLGQGTTWCTASTESDYYYNHYKDTYGGDYYININKHDPEEKYQFHFESGQVMDKDDRSVDLKDLFEENEGLKDFYLPMVENLLQIDQTPNPLPIPMGSLLGVLDLNRELYNHRDGVSRDFVSDIVNHLQGEDDLINDVFDWDIYTYDDDIKNALNYHVDADTLDRLHDMGYTSDMLMDIFNGDYDEDTIDEDTIDEITNTIRNAYTQATENGIILQIVSEFENAIESSMGGVVDYVTILDDYVEIKYTPSEVINAYLDGDYDEQDIETAEIALPEDMQSATAGIISQSFADNFRFFEPYYGWDGFDDDTFCQGLLELPSLK